MLPSFRPTGTPQPTCGNQWELVRILERKTWISQPTTGYSFLLQHFTNAEGWLLSFTVDYKTTNPGYFLGARPASLAHTISYWRTNIPTFGPLGAPGAHRLTFRWALMQFLHSLKCKLFVIMLARTLIQGADLFPRSFRSKRNAITASHRGPLWRRRYPATDSVSNHPSHRSVTQQ